MIIPTGADDPRMTTAKRQTLADFLYYSLCQGQTSRARTATRRCRSTWCRPASPRSAKLKTADPSVDLTKRDVTTCHNPTFVAGQPTREPPRPDRAAARRRATRTGAGPCGTDTGTNEPVHRRPQRAGRRGTAGRRWSRRRWSRPCRLARHRQTAGRSSTRTPVRSPSEQRSID